MTAQGVTGARDLSRQAPRVGWRALTVALAAAILVIWLILEIPSSPARGQTPADRPAASGAEAQAAPGGSPSDFVGEIRRGLLTQENRMIKLADSVFGRGERTRPASEQIADQKGRADVAKAKWEEATLARQIAELRLTEYVDGGFKVELAQVLGEIATAQQEIDKLADQTKEAEERLAKIQQASKGSAVDLALEFDARSKLKAMPLVEKRSRFVLEQAESKKKVLVEYTKTKTIKELRSGIEKARSDELARKETWDLENTKFKRLAWDAHTKDTSSEAKYILTLLEKAISVAERLHAIIEQAGNDRNLTDARRTEMRDAASELRAVVEEAEGAHSQIQFDELKSWIHKAAARAGAPKT